MPLKRRITAEPIDDDRAYTLPRNGFVPALALSEGVNEAEVRPLLYHRTYQFLGEERVYRS